MADLLRALVGEAEARRRDLVAAAEAEAARIAAEADARAAGVAAERRAHRLAERRAEMDRRIGACRREAAARLARARGATLERVLAAAAARLPGALVERPELIDALVAQALIHVDRPCVIRCPVSLADRVRGALAGGDLEVTPDPAARSGVQVLARDGSLSIDATLEGVLEREADTIAVELVRRVERGGAP